MKPSTKKNLLIATSVLAALYLVSFAILAYSGGYVWVRSGHFRPINHLAMTDILVWQPRVGTFYAFRTVGGENTFQHDYLGCFYSPLILLHQRFVAPSIRTIEPDGSPPRSRPSFPTRHQLHPTAQREVPEMERTFGITWEQLAARYTVEQ